MKKPLRRSLSTLLTILLLFGAATTVHASTQTTNERKTYGLSEFVVFSGATVSVDNTCTIDDFVVSVKETD